MTDEAKVSRREYYKRWRKANPDKVKATQERYWTKRYLMEHGQQIETAAGDPGQIAEKRQSKQIVE